MKNPQEIAKTIKELAKEKKITIGKMLSDCELGVNTLSSMQSGGYFPRLEAINKIADYFDVSVDYLLGRTDTPTGYSSNISNVQTTVNSPQISGNNNTIGNKVETISAEDAELLELINKLPLRKRMEFILSLYEEVEKT